MRWRSDGTLAHGLVAESDVVVEPDIDNEPYITGAEAVCGVAPTTWAKAFSGQNVCLECWAIYRAALRAPRP